MSKTARNLLKELMKEASIEDWCNYIEMDNKNFWTLQNNWMYNVEQKYSQEAALQFDGLCYGRAIEVAAYRLKRLFTFGNDDLDTLLRNIYYFVLVVLESEDGPSLSGVTNTGKFALFVFSHFMNPIRYFEASLPEFSS